MKTLTTVKTDKDYNYSEIIEIVSERRVIMIDLRHFIILTADIDFLKNYINFTEVMEFSGVSTK